MWKELEAKRMGMNELETNKEPPKNVVLKSGNVGKLMKISDRNNSKNNENI